MNREREAQGGSECERTADSRGEAALQEDGTLSKPGMMGVRMCGGEGVGGTRPVDASVLPAQLKEH